MALGSLENWLAGYLQAPEKAKAPGRGPGLFHNKRRKKNYFFLAFLAAFFLVVFFLVAFFLVAIFVSSVEL